MKKRLLSLIFLCAAGALGLTGCSDSNGKSSAKVTLGEYMGVEASYTETKVTEADIDAALDEAVANLYDYTDITDRPVQKGDVANIDYEGKIDDVAFDGGTDQGYDLEIGSGNFIPGFEDQLIGMEIGQTEDIQVTFPDPYQNNPDMAGADAVFTVKINSIKAMELPDEITDEVIQSISEDHSTVDEYRAFLRENLEAQAESTNTEAKQTAVWEALAAKCTVENISEDRVQSYVDDSMKSYEEYATMYGVDMATFIESYMGTTEEELKVELWSYGEEYVERIAIAESIAEKENLQVTEEQYQEYVKEQAELSGMETAEFEEAYEEAVREYLLFQNVLEFVIENAVLTVL